MKYSHLGGGKGDLCFVDKGKTVMLSPTVFVKATSSKEVGENSKPVLINPTVFDLKANLISISQLCDQGMLVNFTKKKCIDTGDSNEVNMMLTTATK